MCHAYTALSSKAGGGSLGASSTSSSKKRRKSHAPKASSPSPVSSAGDLVSPSEIPKIPLGITLEVADKGPRQGGKAIKS